MGELVAIRDMVFRMQDSVRPAFVPPPRRLGLFEERQRRFAALATVAGVAADKLHIGPVGNDDEDAELKGMGVTATAPIEGGELFVTVPESLMLSLHVGPAADTVSACIPFKRKIIIITSAQRHDESVSGCLQPHRTSRDS